MAELDIEIRRAERCLNQIDRRLAVADENQKSELTSVRKDVDEALTAALEHIQSLKSQRFTILFANLFLLAAIAFVIKQVFAESGIPAWPVVSGITVCYLAGVLSIGYIVFRGRDYNTELRSATNMAELTIYPTPSGSAASPLLKAKRWRFFYGRNSFGLRRRLKRLYRHAQSIEQFMEESLTAAEGIRKQQLEIAHADILEYIDEMRDECRLTLNELGSFSAGLLFICMGFFGTRSTGNPLFAIVGIGIGVGTLNSGETKASSRLYQQLVILERAVQYAEDALRAASEKNTKLKEEETISS